MLIDLVLPYVDGSKEKWRKLYVRTCQKHNRSKIEPHRFREIVPLKYLLRAINKNCPFIRTVFLVVQDRDQVPDYIKESEYLKVIEHKDIIPETKLPTYNSGTIESYIYNIPELSEQFLYINDDMYPCKTMSESDFFDEKGNPRIHVVLKNQLPNVYRQMLKNSELLVTNLLNIKGKISNVVYYRDGHSWSAMKKSIWKTLHKEMGNIILSRCTTFRDPKNVVQQMCTYYSYFSGEYSEREISTEYFTLNCPITEIREKYKENHIICLNDTKSIKDFENSKEELLKFFEELYPEKSEKYERLD